MIKIWRSPFSSFGLNIPNGDDLLMETYTADSAYTDDVLTQISDSGFNGIWIHAQLHNIVQREELPELGRNASIHQEKLNALICRARKYGIKVYLYMQPPRAIPVSNRDFWEKHADIGGQTEICGTDPDGTAEFRSLCTSTEKVQTYLKNAMSDLTRSLPGLGGFIIISASEYQAHCYTRRTAKNISCPRCSKRSMEDVVCEILTLIYEGVFSVSDQVRVIAWNWSWRYFGDDAEIVRKLPDGITYMADFERGGYKDVLGHQRHYIDEYSISYAGPSEQFRESCDSAAKRGLSLCAKLQFGTTHELATVPNLPLIGNLFKKADYVRKHHFDTIMGCWNFGNMISANTAAFNYFLSENAPDSMDDAMRTFALQYFPGCNPDGVVDAWKTFGDAMDFYPFCIPYLYYGPTNWAIAYFQPPEPLNGKNGGGSWRLDSRGDDISLCIKDFSAVEICSGFEKMSVLWEKGYRLLKDALSSSKMKHAKEELDNALVISCIFRSTFNFFRLHSLRSDFARFSLRLYRDISTDELQNLRRVLPVVEKDPRFGYHSEAHGYQFDAAGIQKKIKCLEDVLK